MTETKKTTGGAGIAVVWFRTDLRTDDNPALVAAQKLVQEKTVASVLPCYFLDPRLFGSQLVPSRESAEMKSVGVPKTGPFRAKFLLESLVDLKERLRALDSDLLIRVGRPEEEIPKLLSEEDPGTAKLVITETQACEEELRVDLNLRKALKPLKGELRDIWGYSLYHREDLPFKAELRDLPDTFTPFKEKCERNCKVRPALPPPKKGTLPLPSRHEKALAFLPSWGDLPWAEELRTQSPEITEEPAVDSKAAFDLKGGESVALARLKYYLWDSDIIAEYFEIRNGMIGGDYSTKLAAHLAHGCISPRRMHDEIRRYEKERTKNKSTYWVIFELTWRDFYRFFAMKHGSRIFHSQGTHGGGPSSWPIGKQADELLQRWKDGTTGWPLVDANMRELRATGFMSNRGRQNVASFLVLDLGLDWRWGARHFETFLTDYDVTSNWGNWVAAAGLTGGRVNKFNILKQSKDYDAGGEYVRMWIPEIREVKGPKVHEPSALSRAEREKYFAGMKDEDIYPPPVKGLGTAPGGQAAKGKGKSSGGGNSKGGGAGGYNSSGGAKGGGKKGWSSEKWGGDSDWDKTSKKPRRWGNDKIWGA